ncbi:MAG: cytidylate kinase family protein [Candidatus Bathyarchaeia archaeon]
MSLVLTISGLHGTGKSTYAQRLAAKFGLRYFSAGRLFRELAKKRGLTLEELSLEASKRDELDRLVDEQTRIEAKKGTVVIDSLLGAWVTKDLANLKILLIAPDDVRIKRIAHRDAVSIEEARRETLYREELERGRFKNFYDIDISNLSIYDLILNTGILSPEGNMKVLESFVEAYIKERRLGRDACGGSR